MIYRFVIDLLKEDREERERKLRYLLQTEDEKRRLRAQKVEINRAIFVLLKEERNK